jgi:alanyl-tRNA synthetase
VGHAADAWARTERQTIREASAILKTDPKNLVHRAASLLDEIKQLKKDLDKARRGGGGADLDTLIGQAVSVDGVSLVAAKVSVDARPTLAALVDRLRDKLPGGVIVLGAELDGSAAVIAAVGPELKGNPRFHAGNIVRGVCEHMGGRGGGRPDFAQGGGKNVAALDTALASVADALPSA